MAEQITIYDILAKKERIKIQPEIWSCVKSCANFTNIRPDGSRDYFPIPGRVPRCVNLDFGESKVIENLWHTWCKNYKPKEK